MLKRVQVSQEIIDILEEKVPDNLIKERRQGNTNLSYVSGNFIIDQLNRAFGYLWDWKIDRAWIEQSIPKKQKDYQTGQTTEVPQAPIAHVIGTLTVHLKDDNGTLISISKTAPGSKVLVGGASEQDSVFKAAHTDALKKAASLFGIAAQLYRNDTEQDYFDEKKVSSLWTSEEEEKHAEDFNYIIAMKEQYNVSDQRVDGMVNKWSNGNIDKFSKLSPTKLGEFVNYLREQQEQARRRKEQKKEG